MVACNTETPEDPDDGLTSKWQLIEQLADPGDGSGTFQPVSSQKTVSFYEDESVVCNGSLCYMTTNVGNGTSGTFSAQDSTILVSGCDFSPPFPLTVEMVDGYLVLNYPCIEPCREKYEQIN
jgi:hypothetical protein